MTDPTIETRLSRIEAWLQRIEVLLTAPDKERQALEESWQSRRHTPPTPDEETPAD